MLRRFFRARSWHGDSLLSLRFSGACGFHICGELLDGGKEVSGFEGFYNYAVGLYAHAIFRFVGLHFADGEEHGSLRGLMRRAHLLADLESGVPRHVNVENNELGFELVNLFKRGRAVADGNDFIPSITQNLLAHVLSSHAVVGE